MDTNIAKKELTQLINAYSRFSLQNAPILSIKMDLRELIKKFGAENIVVENPKTETEHLVNSLLEAIKNN